MYKYLKSCLSLYKFLHACILCIEQHEAAMANLNTELNNSEEELQSAKNCEYIMIVYVALARVVLHNFFK